MNLSLRQDRDPGGSRHESDEGPEGGHYRLAECHAEEEREEAPESRGPAESHDERLGQPAQEYREPKVHQAPSGAHDHAERVERPPQEPLCGRRKASQEKLAWRKRPLWNGARPVSGVAGSGGGRNDRAQARESFVSFGFSRDLTVAASMTPRLPEF